MFCLSIIYSDADSGPTGMSEEPSSVVVDADYVPLRITPEHGDVTAIADSTV